MILVSLLNLSRLCTTLTRLSYVQERWPSEAFTILASWLIHNPYLAVAGFGRKHD